MKVVGSCSVHPGQNFVNCPLCKSEREKPISDVVKFAAARLKELIKESGLTGDEIADCMGLSRQSIVNICSARQAMTLKNLYAFCSILKVNPGVFLPPLLQVNITDSEIEVLVTKTIKRKKIELIKHKPEQEAAGDE